MINLTVSDQIVGSLRPLYRYGPFLHSDILNMFGVLLEEGMLSKLDAVLPDLVDA